MHGGDQGDVLGFAPGHQARVGGSDHGIAWSCTEHDTPGPCGP